jgi:hypothetical protein
MWTPTLDGLIDRRILVNYRLDPGYMARILPPPFRPKVVRGFGLAGICLIRMAMLRPRFFPVSVLGSTENGALRFAVDWEQDGKSHSGVYIPKRFSSSRLVCLLGGRFFPGVHTRADFRVEEADDRYRVEVDGELKVVIQCRATDSWSGSSVFDTLDDASAFYQSGAVGFSDARAPGKYEGLELRIPDWQVRPLQVERVSCNFFDDRNRFPAGTAAFDNALLMRGMRNEFYGRGSFCCPASLAQTQPSVAVR